MTLKIASHYFFSAELASLKMPTLGLGKRAYNTAMVKRLSGFSPDADVPSGGRTEQAFVTAMFMSLGRLAKMDGRVTELEIDYASSIIKKMGLSATGRSYAIDFFEHGKHPDSDVSHAIALLLKAVGKRSALTKLFVQIQCQAALLKGSLRLKDKMYLRDVAETLGYDKIEFQAICGSCQTGFDYCGSAYAYSADSGPGYFSGRTFLQNAYSILQLEPGVADGEIRKAYLRLMSRNHPDKLEKDNLSEDSLRAAQERAMAIRSAYETVCGFRKIRA